MLPPDRAPAYTPRHPVSFAQVLAEETFRDAGVMAWQRVPAPELVAPSTAVEDARLADGSRIAVWPASGAWVAAYARPGTGSIAVLSLADRPTVTDALALARLADAAV